MWLPAWARPPEWFAFRSPSSPSSSKIIGPLFFFFGCDYFWICVSRPGSKIDYRGKPPDRWTCSAEPSELSSSPPFVVARHRHVITERICFNFKFWYFILCYTYSIMRDNGVFNSDKLSWVFIYSIKLGLYRHSVL